MPPFASINAEGERKSVRGSESERVRGCLIFHMEEVRAGKMVKTMAKRKKKDKSQAAQAVSQVKFKYIIYPEVC